MAWVAGLSLLGACGSDAGSGNAGQGSTMPLVPAHERVDCDLPTVIEYCGGATCHYDDAAPEVGSSLALWSRDDQRLVGDPHTRLVNVSATYHNVINQEDCPSQPELLVDPVAIERSLVLTKLFGTHACGDDMPKFPYPEWGTVSNPGPERQEFVDCIRAWLVLLVEDSKREP